MICYVLAIEKQNLGPHVVVGYGIKIFRPGLFITSPDHLERVLSASEGRAAKYESLVTWFVIRTGTTKCLKILQK